MDVSGLYKDNDFSCRLSNISIYCLMKFILRIDFSQAVHSAL